MNSEEVFNTLRGSFPFQLNNGQRELLGRLARFLISKEQQPVFVLKGYAGTGKTTVVRSLVASLPAVNAKSVLLAPTGRAAKVLNNYTGKAAFTIHKKIYMKKSVAGGGFAFQLRPNLYKNTLFIVDEASMISNSKGLSFQGQSSVLDDLFSFVFSGNNCKLLLIGDTAQLPPVKLNISPALDLNFIQQSYPFHLESFELTEVMRQNQDSGILANATQLRDEINFADAPSPKFNINPYQDIVPLTGEELEDAINSAYSKYGVEDTMIICRSNKRANIYNQQIRTRIRWQEDELSSGDYMMVVKNNYYWLPEESKAGFIANGDIIQLSSVGTIEDMHGFRFAQVRFKMVDYPDEPELETLLLLDTIMSENPALSSAENNKLYESVLADYADISNAKERLKKVKEDKYFNALQVKFSYAITCHKSQGGQWPCVFVEQGYLTKEMVNKEYLRWLYTAVTRASKQLYLINFNDSFYN